MGASRIQEETAETTHFRIWQRERRVVARSGDADKGSPRVGLQTPGQSLGVSVEKPGGGHVVGVHPWTGRDRG